MYSHRLVVGANLALGTPEPGRVLK
jgi:hypothetical protein